MLPPLGAEAVAALVRAGCAGADDEFCRRCFELTAGNPLQLRELLAAIEPQEQPRRRRGAWRRPPTRRRARSARSVLRRLAALSPARAGAGARRSPCSTTTRRCALAGRARRRSGPAAALAGRGRARRARTCCAPATRSGSPIRWSAPPSTARCRSASGRRRTGGPRGCSPRRARRASGSARTCSSRRRRATRVVVGRAAGRGAARAGPGRAGAPRCATWSARCASRRRTSSAPAVLAELGARRGGGRAAAAPSPHLEAAIALAATTARARGAAARVRPGAARRAAGLTEASASFRRGLDELGDRATSELALDLEAGYLTSAMHAPELAAGRAPRAPTAILAGDACRTSRAGRALASKAMIMRLFAGAPRAEVLAVAHRLFDDGRLIEEDGADSQALTHVIGSPELVRRLRGGRRARCGSRSPTRGAADRLVTFAMASQLRARQRLWTGPVARRGRGRPRGGRRVARRPADVPARVGVLPGHAGCSSWASRRGRGGARARDARPPASGFFAAWRHAALGRLAADRGDDAAALEAFLAAGRRLSELLVINPTRAPVALGGGARRAAARPARARARAARARSSGSPSASARRGRSGSLAARPGCSPAARRAVERLRVSRRGARRVRRAGRAGPRAGRPRGRGPPRRAPAARRATTLREALALAEAAGARALAERARDELRLAGGRAPRRRRAAATGSRRASAAWPSSPPPARATGRSPTRCSSRVKSVEWHLGNVYRKLDIRGRAELARRLAHAPDPSA